MVQQVSSMAKRSFLVLNHLDLIFTLKMPQMSHFTALVLHADLKSNMITMTFNKRLNCVVWEKSDVLKDMN